MGSIRTLTGRRLERPWPWFPNSREHAPTQVIRSSRLAAAATPTVASSSAKPGPSHSAGSAAGTTTGYATYIGRIGALAVALGVGGAIATGQGLGAAVAWADDSGSASDSSSADSSSTDLSTATSPSVGATDSASVPAQLGSLRPPPAGPNPAPRSRSPVSSANSPQSGIEASGSPTSHPATGSALVDTPTAGDNTSTTPDVRDAQPDVSAGEPHPAGNAVPPHDASTQDSVATNPAPASPQAPTPQHTPPAVGAEGSADGSAVVTHGYAAHTATAPATADAQTPTQRSSAAALPSRTDTIDTASQVTGVEAAQSAQVAIPAQSAASVVTPASTQAVQPATMATPVTPAIIASGLLAVVGLTPLAPGPGAPVEPPAMWTMLAVAAARRQTPANQAPTLDLMQTSQGLDGPVHGTFGGADPNVTIDTIDQAAGTFTHNPDVGYVGTDQLTVTVSDIGDLGLRLERDRTATATVAITVSPSSEAPLIVGAVILNGYPSGGLVFSEDGTRAYRTTAAVYDPAARVVHHGGDGNRRLRRHRCGSPRHAQRRPQWRRGVERGRHPRLPNHLRLQFRH